MMMERVFDELQADGRFAVEHLPYRFSEAIEDQGRLSFGKLRALVSVTVRVLWLRRSGPVDIYLHPIGGPGRASTLRDVALLPVIRTVSRRTVVRFHGAGHARVWRDVRSPLVRLARRALSRCDAAIVQASTNVVDPNSVGIEHVFVMPNRISDEFDPALVQRDDIQSELRVAYVGHLGPHRGTPELIRAAAALRAEIPGLVLELAGNTTVGYTLDDLHRDIEHFGASGCVRFHGVITGSDKSRFLGRAHLLAFPSIFESESFGLVLVEALMWGLPVVATDFRANGEVLGASSGTDVALHDWEPELGSAVLETLRQVALRLRAGTTPSFSQRNRVYFERHYVSMPGVSLEADALSAWIDEVEQHSLRA